MTTQNENSMPPTPTAGGENGRRGLPLWMPFAGLLVAFAFAVFVGGNICPTLTTLVFPPQPPLPPGEMTVREQRALGTGKDEWVYATPIEPCAVLKYYEDRIGGCEYDPDIQCERPGFGTRPRDGSSYPIAMCQNTMTVGSVNLVWTVRIGGGYPQPEITRFRVTREIGN